MVSRGIGTTSSAMTGFGPGGGPGCGGGCDMTRSAVIKCGVSAGVRVETVLDMTDTPWSAVAIPAIRCAPGRTRDSSSLPSSSWLLPLPCCRPAVSVRLGLVYIDSLVGLPVRGRRGCRKGIGVSGAGLPFAYVNPGPLFLLLPNPQLPPWLSFLLVLSWTTPGAIPAAAAVAAPPPLSSL